MTGRTQKIIDWFHENLWEYFDLSDYKIDVDKQCHECGQEIENPMFYVYIYPKKRYSRNDFNARKKLLLQDIISATTNISIMQRTK